MPRNFLKVGLVLSLVLGCWGGALAAALCPHMACETTSIQPGCAPTHVEVVTGHEGGGHEGHSNRIAEHSEHSEAHDMGQSAGTPARDQDGSRSQELQGAASRSHDSRCTHCMGGTNAPPSSSFEWQANSVIKGGKYVASHSAVQLLMPAAVLVRKVNPAQHAPPGSSDRHLLLNIFRI